MRDTTKRAIGIIEGTIMLEALRDGQGIKGNYEALRNCLPEISSWGQIQRRQLFCYLERTHNIQLGVCEHYHIDDYSQYCDCNPQHSKTLCNCSIPQPYCIYRDKNGPRYPELMPKISPKLQAMIEEARSAL